MDKVVLLHDIYPAIVSNILGDKYKIVTPTQNIKPCVGCFNCWFKNPGMCIIPDDDSNFAPIMGHAEKIIVVSRIVFGGFSPNIKAIFDRSIGYVLPFFKMVNNEMHHVERYEEASHFHYIFYGNNITKNEKETAQKLRAFAIIKF
jgi:multimeric flavodoxin WrbA